MNDDDDSVPDMERMIDDDPMLADTRSRERISHTRIRK
jgi:hypothetical protein